MRPRGIILTAETGSDLTAEEARELGVRLVPMHVAMGGETRRDGSFPTEEICAYYDRTGRVPQTSAASQYDFARVFEEIGRGHPGACIVHLAYSAATTASYHNALISGALNLHPAIHVTDGKLVAGRKYRGSMVKVAQKLVRDEAGAHNFRRERLWFIESPGLPDEVRRAAESEARALGFESTDWVKTGCVITCHGGPGAFGVVGISQ